MGQLIKANQDNNALKKIRQENCRQNYKGMVKSETLIKDTSTCIMKHLNPQASKSDKNIS